jgi:hypothetical protein
MTYKEILEEQKALKDKLAALNVEAGKARDAMASDQAKTVEAKVRAVAKVTAGALTKAFLDLADAVDELRDLDVNYLSRLTGYTKELCTYSMTPDTTLADFLVWVSKKSKDSGNIFFA